MGTLGAFLGIVGVAVLFALIGLMPLSHRGCGSCSGDCESCPLEDDDE